MISLASEFPNDNPALHTGVSWVCLETTGAPVAESFAPIVSQPPVVADPPPEPPPEVEVPPPAVSGIVAVAHADEADDEIVVEEIPPLDETAMVEGAAEAPEAPLSMVAETLPPPAPVESTALPPPPDDPFTAFLCALADVALAAGSPHVAALLPALLVDGRLEHGVSEDAALALAEAGVLDGGEVSERFVAQARAWREILRGASEDFEACGTAMLDEWAADLVACLLGSRARATTLRRDLRSRGVAAFGLASAAA